MIVVGEVLFAFGLVCVFCFVVGKENEKGPPRVN